MLPARFASGTVPPPVLERPLPSLFEVAARIQAHKAAGLRPPYPSPPAALAGSDDDVEEIAVDLDDDEILLSESDLL